jgi:FMN phosphatase YigB (HAD superfamily)
MGKLFGRKIDLLCLDLDDTLIATEAGAAEWFEDVTRSIRRIHPDISAATIADAAASAGWRASVRCGRDMSAIR